MEYINDSTESKETIKEEERPRKKRRTSHKTISIRIARSTERTIRTIVSQVNKKKIGRKVVPDDVISKALSLIQEEHLEDVKRSTYSVDDLLSLRHREYCEQHGHISKESFLEILFRVDLSDSKSTSDSESTKKSSSSGFESE